MMTFTLVRLVLYHEPRALKFPIGLHKLIAMIFAVSFEIIIQRAVGYESCYPIKNTLIITVLSNRSRKSIVCYSRVMAISTKTKNSVCFAKSKENM
jgi:hypothetical protein